MNKRILFLLAVFFISVSSFAQKSVSASELFNQGLEYQNGRNWWLASEKFQEAVQKNPVYTEAWFHLAQCVYELDQFDMALNYLETAEKYSASRSDILNLHGLTLISLGRFDAAEEMFRDILKKYPNDVDARFGLAELDLFKGRLIGAENLYTDALRREGQNVKALLSLALVSAELGKNREAEQFVNQAMQAQNGNEEVYYIASYLAFRRGNLTEAEKRCLSAVQINGNYADAYELLSLIYYQQGRYEEVIDIAEYQISHSRENAHAWYMKGLSLERLGRPEAALATWTKGLDIRPEDEVMRAAFELLVSRTVSLEDSRRENWAKYHVLKASEYQKKYAGPEMRYEYQAALRINPENYTARKAFSNLLKNDGFNEIYLEQLRFIQNNDLLKEKLELLKKNGKPVDEKDAEALIVRLSDTVEGYDSLLNNTIASKWDVNPFFLDKERWNIGIYYTEKITPVLHADLSRITAETLAVLFRGVLGTSVNTETNITASYGEAYKDAHKKGFDYFVILETDETERDLKLDAVMYSARNGTETKRFSVFKTGNDRFVHALLVLREDMLSLLPVRAKLLERSGRDVLVDMGKTEGIPAGAKFAVIKKGELRTRDTGAGLYYSDSSILGYVTLTKVSEELSEGELSDTGFYDRVNARDELVLVSVPEKNDSSDVADDTSPQANADGETVLTSPLRGVDITASRTPSLVNMIRKIY